MPSFSLKQKILLVAALAFLYLLYAGDLFSLVFLPAFIASIALIVFLETRKNLALNAALSSVFEFFRDLTIPLTAVFGVSIAGPLFFLFVLETNIGNVTFLPFTQIWLFMVVGLPAPIWEEIVFRGLLLGKTKKLLERLKVQRAEAIALLISSVAFGLVHPLQLNLSPLAMAGLVLVTSAIGFILGLQFLKKGLVSAIWLHGLYNLVAFLYVYTAYWEAFSW